MFETLIFAILIIALNILFAIKPHPIMGIGISFLTFFLCVFYFISDTTLPMNTPNPIFTIFMLFIAGFNSVCQWYDYKKPH